MLDPEIISLRHKIHIYAVNKLIRNLLFLKKIASDLEFSSELETTLV